jgi:hypothetical protein
MHRSVQSTFVVFIVSCSFTAVVVTVEALVELGPQSAQLDGLIGSELLCGGIKYEQTALCEG